MKNIFLILFLISLIVFIASIFVPIESLFLRVLAQHSILLFLALYFLFEKNISFTLKKLGIPGDMKKNILYTVGGLISFIAILMTMNLLISVFDLKELQTDGQKVPEIVDNLPISILLLAVLLAPLSEELFFRGLLTSRFGPIISSILFALVHLAYGSVLEIVGTLVLGFILAYIYLKSKSIIPSILIHAIYNALAILLIRVVV